MGWGVFGAIFPTHPPPKKGVLGEKNYPPTPEKVGVKIRHPTHPRIDVGPSGITATSFVFVSESIRLENYGFSNVEMCVFLGRGE